MKERPILFSGAMVRAILEGRKRQTRRVIKRKDGEMPLDFHDGMFWFADGGAFAIDCPYGVPGDRLWVRHGFWLYESTGTNPGNRHAWDEYTRLARWANGAGIPDCQPQIGPGSFYVRKPSIHMPRWASRLLLEITGVRVERVQDISAADCLAEGVTFPGRDAMLQIAPIAPLSDAAHLRNAYQTLWDSINKKRGYSFDSNPWVRVVEFRRLP